MRFDQAVIVTVVAGYLFLPSGASMPLPALPAYNKLFATVMALGLGWLFFRPPMPKPLMPAPRRRLVILLVAAALVLVFVQPFFTQITNRGAIVIGESFRPGLGLSDTVRAIQLLVLLLFVFVLAWFYLGSERSRRSFLEITVYFSLAYSLLALFEMRMSPQLSNWVYGYFPHEWLQHVRGGAFRPVVFLPHGLWLGFWFLTATLSAFILFRDETSSGRRMFWLVSGLWLFLVLALSRNLGAFVIALGFVPLVLFSWRRLQVRVAMAVAIIFMTFPALRQADLVPLDDIVVRAEAFDPKRARSLLTRIENEDRLIARALEKPLWGWGGWGRARVYNEEGKDISITDGLWVIILGERGWLGYIGYFGLVAAPLLLLPGLARRRRVSTTLAGSALLVSTALIYSVPNAAMVGYVWLYAGAIVGAIQYGTTQKEADEDAIAPEPGPERRIRYTRFGAEDRAASAYRRL